MIPTIHAEWPIHVDLIQKLPMFVSHIDIVVMHLTAVSSNIYQPDILIEFSELTGVKLSGYKSPNNSSSLSHG